MPLSSAQVRHLRGLAHALRPVVMVGAKGANAAVLAELETALAHHELVKVRVAVDDRAARDALGAELAQGTGAEVVQRIGKIVCLYRRNPDEPRIALPR